MKDKKLDVELKIQLDGKTVVAECKHIDESLRGKGEIIRNGNYSIKSCSCTTVGIKILYVRGNDVFDDYKVTSNTFETKEQASNFVNIMNELIEELNNPVIEIRLDERKDYILENEDVFCVKRYNTHVNMSYWKNLRSIKSWYVDNTGKEGQYFSEVEEEFNLFCKNRKIKAKLILPEVKSFEI